MLLTKLATKMEQTSGLFVDRIQFFSYYNNGTLKHRDSESFSGCYRPI